MRGAQHAIRNADSSSGVAKYNKLESAPHEKLLIMTELSKEEIQAKKMAIAFAEFLRLNYEGWPDGYVRGNHTISTLYSTEQLYNSEEFKKYWEQQAKQHNEKV